MKIKTKHWTRDSHKILEQATGLKKYNRWLISHFSPYFGRTILEIGSGQGALSRLFPQAIIILSDVIPEYISQLKKIFTDPVIKLDIEKESPKNLKEKINTIFSSNVFEHIKDDRKALANCYQLLEGGGYLLLFVPARPEIYVSLDDEMGHYRRYTKRDLRKKAEQAGFQVEKIYYANLPGYFLWWSRGMIGTSRADNKFAKIFDNLIVPFLYLEKYLRPPVGQSLVMVARKPK